MPLDLEDGLDRLYGAELADFVAERKSLASALKKEGRKAEAAGSRSCASLRFRRGPSTSSCGASGRTSTRCSTRASGSRRRSARCSPASGRAAFAEARRREQAAVKRLRDGAVWILGKRASDATLDRVVSTLGAAAVTADGRAQLAQGRLTGEIAPQGFEAFAGLAPPAAPAAAKRAAPPKPAPRPDRRKLRQEAIAAAREKLNAAREREAGARRGAPRRRPRRRGRPGRRSTPPSARPTASRADQEAAAEAVAAARRELDAAKRT